MNASEARVKAKQLSTDGKTYAEIAKILMDNGYRGPQGGTKLGPSTVSNLINYGIKPRGKVARAVARRAAPTIAASHVKPGSKVISAVRAILDLGESMKANLIASLFEG